MKKALPVTDGSVTPDKVLRRFRVVFNAVRTHFRKMEKQVGLGGAQVWALSVIKAHPGIGMGELASQMQIHQSTASNSIKLLLQQDLISAEKAPNDRRNVRLKILPAGTRLLKKVPGPFEGVLPVALSNLSAETLQRLDTDLGELIALLNADESAEEALLSSL
jgi:DNA-binding MarR family transcriptional regulator